LFDTLYTVPENQTDNAGFILYNRKGDPYAHLRHSRVRGKKPKKAPKPGIRKITREAYAERVSVAAKVDGILLLTTSKKTGKVIDKTLLTKDELDRE
jgi:hypothetical protein